MLYGVLQILLHTLLPDHLRNASLGLDIEGVRIQIGNVLLPPGLLLPLALLHHLEGLCEPLWALDHTGQLWPLANGLLTQLRVPQELETDGLRVWVPRGATTLRRSLLTRWLWPGSGRPAGIPHMEGEHLAVADLQLLHRLGVVGQQLAIVVEVLGGLGYLGLRLDGFLERAHSGVCGDLEGEEVGIYVRGCGDGEGDPPGRLDVSHSAAQTTRSRNRRVARTLWAMLEYLRRIQHVEHVAKREIVAAREQQKT